MRRHDAARRGVGASWLPREQSRDRAATLRDGTRPVPGNCRRGRAVDGRLYARGPAVFPSGGRNRTDQTHPTRQSPRDRGLVERRRRGGTEDGGASGGGQRISARRPCCQPEERGRHFDIRLRRAGCRSRQSLEGPSRRHGPDTAARDYHASRRHRFPGGDGPGARRDGPSGRVRDHGRRFRAAGAVLARRAVVRAVARWRAIALRHRPRSVGRAGAVPDRSARRLSARPAGQSRRDAESRLESA